MLTLVKYEIVQMNRRKDKYILFLILIIMAAYYMKMKVTSYMTVFYPESFKGVGVLDIILYIFSGASKNFLIFSKNVELPISYLIYLVYMSVMTYCIFDGKNDNNIVLKIGSKKKWLFSKLIISFINLLLYYFMVLLVTMFITKFNFDYNEIADTSILKLDYYNTRYTDISLLLLCSFLTSLAIMMIQIFLVITVNEFVALIVTLSIYVFSMFNCTYLFIANGTMLTRSNLFLKSGLEFNSFILIDFVIIIVSLVLTIMMLNKKDFY